MLCHTKYTLTGLIRTRLNASLNATDLFLKLIRDSNTVSELVVETIGILTYMSDSNFLTPQMRIKLCAVVRTNRGSYRHLQKYSLLIENVRTPYMRCYSTSNMCHTSKKETTYLTMHHVCRKSKCNLGSPAQKYLNSCLTRAIPHASLINKSFPETHHAA